MSQLEGDIDHDTNASSATSHGTNSLGAWLQTNRLQVLHDKLVEQGFERKEDFEGLQAKDLDQLWIDMGFKKIGLKNRFFKAVKNTVFQEKNIIVINTNEEKTLKKLQNAIENNTTIADQIKQQIKRMYSKFQSLFITMQKYYISLK